MPITINGAGSIVGISAGGLPDASVVTADIADANVTAAKLSGAQTGSAPIYGCRAWVNFDGTRNEADTGASTNGANVKIRASGNVTSVLKNGTGDYTVTFTTAMPDANFAATVACNSMDNGNSVTFGSIGAYDNNAQTLATNTTLVVRAAGSGGDPSPADSAFMHVAIFR
jgi:hypothetical protein